MKKLFLAAGVAALLCGITSCQNSEKGADNLTTYEDSLAYYMGYSQGGMIGQQIDQMMSPEEKARFDKKKFLKGLKEMLMTDTANMDYLEGVGLGLNMAMQLGSMQRQGVDIDRKVIYKEFAKAFMADTLNQMDLQMAVGTFQRLMMESRDRQKALQEEKEREGRKAQAAENIKKGEEFVKKAKEADPEIKTTASGLSYKVLKQGTGPTITENDIAKVHYTGKLIDGTEFDSSIKRGEPLDFKTSQVVPGFAEALKMMNKGSKYEIYLPSSLAYGDNDTGGIIPPGSTLIFTLEIIDVTPETTGAEKTK
ncbi:MAG: FKBP-type peptidyl-prolyl cis-trans isomerase [Paramuribaculum sp.]|nr:FKBP-type peptidyl-prolyl cis-trans isomerase [Paramuribaculum sp.]